LLSEMYDAIIMTTPHCWARCTML